MWWLIINYNLLSVTTHTITFYINIECKFTLYVSTWIGMSSGVIK